MSAYNTGGSVSSVETSLRQRRTDRPPYLYVDSNRYLMRLLRHSDHITDALASLHWLRVAERIQFNKKVMHGTVPLYLGPLVRFTFNPAFSCQSINGVLIMLRISAFCIVIMLLASLNCFCWTFESLQNCIYRVIKNQKQ